jgi:TetR/AcrR family transcriptional repressor of nem operon
MKVNREQVAANRRKILESAGRLFRERGFEAVTVAEVMHAAGLTHGGFYGHFASKDDLIAQCLAHRPGGVEGGGRTVEKVDLLRYANAYLSPRHIEDVAGGCIIAGLGPDTLRQGPEARAALTASLKRQIERLSDGAPGNSPAKRRRAAIGSWSAMVGAVILARISDDPALAKDILAQTRDWIGEKAAKRS